MKVFSANFDSLGVEFSNRCLDNFPPTATQLSLFGLVCWVPESERGGHEVILISRMFRLIKIICHEIRTLIRLKYYLPLIRFYIYKASATVDWMTFRRGYSTGISFWHGKYGG